jgi:hypothetical protein
LDDRALVGVCVSAPGRPDPTRDDVMVQLRKGHAGYDVVGIARGLEKSVLDASEGVVRGGQFSSARKFVGGDIAIILALVLSTAMVILAGRCSSVQFERIISTWVRRLMLRRPGLCVLGRSCGWLRRPGFKRSSARRLPRYVLDELLSVVVLWPLLRADLTSLVAPKAYASDATLEQGGGCYLRPVSR